MSRVVDRVFRGVDVLIAGLLALMVVLTFTNVVLRYAFSTGFVWSEEVTRLSFIYLVYLGAVLAFRDNEHLGVDTLLEKASPLVAKVLYVLVQLVIIWVSWLLVQGSWDLAVQNLDDRWTATQFPSALVIGVGVLAGGAIALLCLANLFRLLVLKRSVADLVRPKDEGAALAVE